MELDFLVLLPRMPVVKEVAMRHAKKTREKHWAQLQAMLPRLTGRTELDEYLQNLAQESGMFQKAVAVFRKYRGLDGEAQQLKDLAPEFNLTPGHLSQLQLYVEGRLRRTFGHR